MKRFTFLKNTLVVKNQDVIRNILEKRGFDLKKEEFPEIHRILKFQKWEHFKSLIQSMHINVIKEFQANAFLEERAPPYYISWVRGKEEEINWKTVNKVLKTKFKKPQCKVQHECVIPRANKPYEQFLELLSLPGKNGWSLYQSRTQNVPRKI